jgi:hypothetical protein
MSIGMICKPQSGPPIIYVLGVTTAVYVGIGRVDLETIAVAAAVGGVAEWVVPAGIVRQGGQGEQAAQQTYQAEAEQNQISSSVLCPILFHRVMRSRS